MGFFFFFFTASLIICKCKIINGRAPCRIKRQANVFDFLTGVFVDDDDDDDDEFRLPLVINGISAFAKNRTAP